MGADDDIEVDPMAAVDEEVQKEAEEHQTRCAWPRGKSGVEVVTTKFPSIASIHSEVRGMQSHGKSGICVSKRQITFARYKSSMRILGSMAILFA